MTTFGVTANGFVQKQLADIITSLQTRLEAAFGTAILDQVLSSGIANMNNAIAGELALAWQLGQDIWSSQYPNSATGVSLGNIGLITGASPLPATQSSVIEVLIGVNGTVVGAGTLGSVNTTGAIFAQVASATIVTVPAWVTATTYTGQSGVGPAFVIGSLVSRSGNIYYCVTGGVSSGGPSGTGNNITDGTCVWNYCGAGSAAVATMYKSQAFNVIQASADTLVTILTPVSNLNAIINPLSATLGSLQETDAAFRVRRNNLLRSLGNGTIAAITSKLLSVAGVSNVTVVNNNTNLPVNGQPANSFAAYVLGGVNQDIWNALVGADPAGIQPYGTVIGTANDTLGNPQTMAFSRPTTVPIYVSATLQRGLNYSGDSTVQAAVSAYGNAVFGSAFGQKVIWNLLFSPMYLGYGVSFPVAGVTEVLALTVGTTPSPAGIIDVPIGATSIAVFDPSRVILS